jgi:hypothetical protein
MIAERRTRGKIRFKKRHNIDVEKRGDPDLPGRDAMVKNAIKAAGQLLTKGFKPATKEEIQKRESICKKCEYFRKKDNRCSKCGCHLAWKNRLRAWHCPDERW